MAYEEALKKITVLAASDLSSSQWRAMDINASGKLAAPSAGAAAKGVLQDDPNADGVAGCLAIGGVSRAEAGGAITAGDEVTPGTSGKLVTAGTGDVSFGTALTGASGDGSIFSVLIQPQTEPIA